MESPLVGVRPSRAGGDILNSPVCVAMCRNEAEARWPSDHRALLIDQPYVEPPGPVGRV